MLCAPRGKGEKNENQSKTEHYDDRNCGNRSGRSCRNSIGEVKRYNLGAFKTKNYVSGATESPVLGRSLERIYKRAANVVKYF